MRLIYTPMGSVWYLMWNDTIIRIGLKSELIGWCKQRGITLIE